MMNQNYYKVIEEVLLIMKILSPSPHHWGPRPRPRPQERWD